MTQKFFETSGAGGALVDILLLVDASLPPKETDLAGVTWLQKRHLPVTLVFTKIDKSKPRLPAPSENIMAFRAAIEEAGSHIPPHFATSAVTGKGRDLLLPYLARRRAAAVMGSKGA